MTDLATLAPNLDALNKATESYNQKRLQSAIDTLAGEYMDGVPGLSGDPIIATAKAATGWLPSAARKSLELAVLAAAALGVAVVVYQLARAVGWLT